MISMKYAQLDNVSISRFKNCGVFKLKYKGNYNNYHESFRIIVIK